MNTYEKTIYDWLIQDENLLNAWELSDHLNNAKKQLHTEFYERLKTALQEASKEFAEYEYVEYQSLSETWPHVGFKLKENESVRILFERFQDWPYFGMRLNEDLHDLVEKNKEKYTELCHGNGLVDGKLTQWWLGHHYLEFNFNDRHTYVKILPKNRDQHVANCIDLCVRFAKAMLPLAQSIAQQAKSKRS